MLLKNKTKNFTYSLDNKYCRTYFKKKKTLKIYSNKIQT